MVGTAPTGAPAAVGAAPDRAGTLGVAAVVAAIRAACQRRAWLPAVALVAFAVALGVLAHAAFDTPVAAAFDPCTGTGTMVQASYNGDSGLDQNGDGVVCYYQSPFFPSQFCGQDNGSAPGGGGCTSGPMGGLDYRPGGTCPNGMELLPNQVINNLLPDPRTWGLFDHNNDTMGCATISNGHVQQAADNAPPGGGSAEYAVAGAGFQSFRAYDLSKVTPAQRDWLLAHSAPSTLTDSPTQVQLTTDPLSPGSGYPLSTPATGSVFMLSFPDRFAYGSSYYTPTSPAQATWFSANTNGTSCGSNYCDANLTADPTTSQDFPGTATPWQPGASSTVTDFSSLVGSFPDELGAAVPIALLAIGGFLAILLAYAVIRRVLGA